MTLTTSAWPSPPPPVAARLRLTAVTAVPDRSPGRRLRSDDVDLRGQSRDGDAARTTGDVDVVHAGGAVDDDRVGLAVAGAGAAREVEVDLGQVGARQVVDGDGVGPTEGV